MSIYRGAGGAGDAVADSASEALLIRDLVVEAQEDADAAAASASAAAGSASTASTQATNASNSASSASTSATNASNSASSASTSATNAGNSATAAQTAETNAETAETNAETAASLAQEWATKLSTPVSGSDYSAKYNANLAAASASSASTSASNAASAQSAAESARDATLAAYDSFDDRYLGAKSSAPSVDNDGNALAGGALYFDTVSQGMKVYTGSAWVDAYVPGSTYLAKASNLSDLTNTATARTNLGVAIGTDVQAYDADLATIAGLTPTNNYAIIGNGTSWTSSALPVSGVTSVTGTAPISSSGGTTPAISLSTNYGDTQNPYASKTANFVLAAPNGSSGAPTFRAVVAADIPTLNQNTTGTASNVTGTVAVANGGTGLTSSGTAGNVLTSNGTTWTSSAPSASSVMRNRIINGAMTIDQRSSGAAVTIATTANVYTLDRWVASGALTDGVFTIDQDTTAPTGFTNSLKVAVTTADASIGSGQYYGITQWIEGFNVADLGWGTANAKTVTLSFWVQSSVVGTFGGALNNSANSRNYPFTYTINVANTWEYKTVTIAGDTTGTWLTDSGRGIGLRFGFGIGSDFLATAGAWTGTSSIFGATGQTQLISTLNATWYITGVQLEVGTQATGFEYRQYQQELALCQRYALGLRTANQGLGSGLWYTSGATIHQMQFPVEMRTAPTLTTNTGISRFYLLGNSVNNTSGNITINVASPTSCEFYTTVSGGTGGQGTTAALVSGICILSSEL